MNGIDFGITQGVQGAGSGGYSVPIFRLNQGTNAATATTKARGSNIDGLYADIVGDGDLDPTSALRATFDNDVIELNNWVASVMEKGYDPINPDYSDPTSVQLYREFQDKRVQMKNMADNLRASLDYKKRMASKGYIVDPTDDAVQTLEESFETGYDKSVQELNKSISASGYTKGEGLDYAINTFSQGLAAIEQGYLSDREQVKGNANLLRKVDAAYSKAIGGAKTPMLKTESPYARERMNLEIAKYNLRAAQLASQQDQGEVRIFTDKRDLDAQNIDPNEPLVGSFSEVLSQINNGGQAQYEYAQAAYPTVKVTQSDGFVIENGVPKKSKVTNGEFDTFELLPVDESGTPIIDGSGGKFSGRFGVFAVGMAKSTRKSGKGQYSFDQEYDAVSYIPAESVIGRSKNKTLSKTLDEMNKLAKAQSGAVQAGVAERSQTTKQTQGQEESKVISGSQIDEMMSSGQAEGYTRQELIDYYKSQGFTIK